MDFADIKAFESKLGINFTEKFLSVENQEYSFGYLSTFTNSKDVYDRMCEEG